jgi:hypothetical protein
MGELANEGQHLFEAHEPLARRGRTPDGLADRLLHWFGLVIHGGKVSSSAAGGQPVRAGDFAAADLRRASRHPVLVAAD